jgi:tetratricopeptide (TPR) repeat protein
MFSCWTPWIAAESSALSVPSFNRGSLREPKASRIDSRPTILFKRLIGKNELILKINQLITNHLIRFCSKLALLSIILMALSYSSFAQRDKRRRQDGGSLSSARLSEAESVFTEGEKFFILEDYSKALLYFLRASELNPTNATIHYKLAEVLAKSSKEEDLRKASISIEQAIKGDKKNKYYYLLAANINSSLGQFSKSASLLETMLKEVPETEEYLYELATIYLFDKKEEEAIKVYNRAESALGINEASSLQKQRIYLDKSKVPEAIAEGEKLIQAFPEEERYILALAELLSQNKQTEKAINNIETFLKDNPDSPSAKMLLGGLYRDNGQEKKSRDYVTDLFDDPQVAISSKIIMLSTYNATLAQSRAKGKEDVDLETFVLELFQKLEILHSSDPGVHVVGGDLFLTLQKNDEAKKQYLKAIRNGANSFESWQNLLFLETQSNEYDSVIIHSEEALEAFPNQAMVYYFNGYAHLRKRDYRLAVSSLEQAKKLSTSNPDLVAEMNSMLGDAYQSLKEYDKSAKAYDEALTANPLNDVVLNNYSYYLSLRKSDLDKAEKMSSLLIKNHPTNAAYLDTHAWVLYNHEKYKEAKKVIERAIATGNASAIHFEHYGDILFQLGDIDEAVTQWQKAKSLDNTNVTIDKKIANRKIY